MAKQSITVAQHWNPEYNSTKPEGPDNREHSFSVEKTVNTLIEPIGKYITKDRVQDLIDNGIDVTVLPVK